MEQQFDGAVRKSRTDGPHDQVLQSAKTTTGQQYCTLVLLVSLQQRGFAAGPSNRGNANQLASA